MSERALELAARAGGLADTALTLAQSLSRMMNDAPEMARKLGGQVIAAVTDAIREEPARDDVSDDVVEATLAVLKAAVAWSEARPDDAETENALLDAVDALIEAEQVR